MPIVIRTGGGTGGSSVSGGDADTVDGRHASEFALLSGAEFTGEVSAARFTGDGGGLTNVSADRLGGRPASDYVTVLTSVVPPLTADVDQGCTVTSSSAAVGWEGWKAFDRSLDTAWGPDTSGAGWLQIELPATAAVTRVELVRHSQWRIREFTLAGSADGATWTEIIREELPDDDSIEHVYDLLLPAEYRIWRLEVISVWGGGSAVRELRLLAAGGAVGDADTVDGHHADEFALLAGAAFTGRVRAPSIYAGRPELYRDVGAGSASLEMGGWAGSWVCNVQDGTGRVSYRWNATSGPQPKFVVDGDRAVEWDLDGWGSYGLTIRLSQPNGGAGTDVTWGDLMSVGAWGIRTYVPLKLKTYAAATLPDPRLDGMVIYVSDGDAGGPCLAVSVGGSWRRVSLGAAI